MVCVFRQKFTLEDAIGSHACSLQVSRRVTNGIPLGCPLFIPVRIVNYIQTLKADGHCYEHSVGKSIVQGARFAADICARGVLLDITRVLA
jgi:hypothetical protein